jgi:hypothetical protein
VNRRSRSETRVGTGLVWLFAWPLRLWSIYGVPLPWWIAPSQHRAKWEPNVGGIWEDRSAVNRGVPRPTAHYGTGATCRFSVSGGRGRARAALGVKGSQVRILSSRRLRQGPLFLVVIPGQRAFLIPRNGRVVDLGYGGMGTICGPSVDTARFSRGYSRRDTVRCTRAGCSSDVGGCGRARPLRLLGRLSTAGPGPAVDDTRRRLLPSDP